MRVFGRRNRQVGADNNNNVSATDFQQQATELIPAEVRMISGCHSEQTSADVSNVGNKLPNPAGRAGGACTSALLEILYSQPQISFQDLLLKLRSSLSRSGFDQIPQLTSSRPLELQQTPFDLGGTNPHGRRRALLVGINYRGQSGQLSGCHNDVLNMKKYLITHHGFPEHDILLLMDDGGRHVMPTRQKMIAGLQQLVAHSAPGDSVYFHYSGHGGLLDSDGFNMFKSGQKQYDETLYPLDHVRAGQIRDFSLFNHFVKPMPAGVRVNCVMDCCHSGTVLDLPYSFKPTSGGMIQTHRSMDNLSNLAFLYILAGGMVPHGSPAYNNIQETVDGDIEDYQGAGAESEMNDLVEQDDSAFVDGGDYGDPVGGDEYGEAVDGGDVGDVVDDTGAADAFDGGNVAAEDYGDAGGFGGFGGDAMRAEDYGGGGTMEAPPTEFGDAGGGFGGFGGFGGDDGGGDAGDVDPGVDCGCVADVLGALLEQDE